MASKQKIAASRELLAERPGVSGEAEAANVEEAQEEGNSNFWRDRTVNQWTNLSVHTSVAKDAGERIYPRCNVH